MKLGSNLLALILVLSGVVMISLAFQKKTVEGIDPTLSTADPDIVKKLTDMIQASTKNYSTPIGQVYRNIVTELDKIKDHTDDSTGYTMLLALYNSAKLNNNPAIKIFANDKLLPIIARANAPPVQIKCKDEVWSIAQPDSYPAPNGYTPWVSTIPGKPGKYKLLPTNQPYNCNDGGKVLPKYTSPLKFMAVNTLDVTKKGLLSSNASEAGTPGVKKLIDIQLTTVSDNIYNK